MHFGKRAASRKGGAEMLKPILQRVKKMAWWNQILKLGIAVQLLGRLFAFPSGI
jgi:hypothetical protein